MLRGSVEQRNAIAVAKAINSIHQDHIWYAKIAALDPADLGFVYRFVQFFKDLLDGRIVTELYDLNNVFEIPCVDSTDNTRVVKIVKNGLEIVARMSPHDEKKRVTFWLGNCQIYEMNDVTFQDLQASMVLNRARIDILNLTPVRSFKLPTVSLYRSAPLFEPINLDHDQEQDQEQD